MLNLFCAPKLLKQMKYRPLEEPAEAPCQLGDWRLATVRNDEAPLVLGVSELSLLPVLFVADFSSGLVAQLSQALGPVLLAIGVTQPFAFAEASAVRRGRLRKWHHDDMESAVQDFARMAALFPDANTSPLRVSIYLANTPFGRLGSRSPAKVTRDLFAGTHRHLRLIAGEFSHSRK